MKHVKCYIKDFPRPQLTRKNWLNLNGEWDFIYKKEDCSLSLRNGFTTEKKIRVPFTYETELSGINDQTAYDEVWYSRKIHLTKEQLTDTVLLHFEGSDYQTTVFVNGEFVGRNEGAYHRFSFDIRKALREGENCIAVKVTDSLDFTQPRGKQRWHDYNFACFYVQTTGIWKTVWLEFLSENYLKTVKITPDFDHETVLFEVEPAACDADVTCEITVTYDGKFIQRGSTACGETVNAVQLRLDTQNSLECSHYWSFHCPCLYDVDIRFIKDGKIIDEVGSYFGLREFKTDGHKLLLNKQATYLKLVLDQGYYKRSGITPPDEETLVKDIELSKAMGFNGARKHQKVEDERYLYYADVMGFVVWCEMPSAYCFSDEMTGRCMREWQEIVRQNYNHPSVFAWVVLNESWGVRSIATNAKMQSFANAMYYQTKAIDSMRPVISNDGWEHTVSDILTIHHYEQNPDRLLACYDSVEKLTEGYYLNWQKQPYAEGYRYGGQPIIISEYGGTAYIKDHANGNWGYGVGCKDENELAERFEGLYQAIQKMPNVAGLCYTQLTDVEQEVNGLLDMDRNPKIDLDRIKTILSK